ncbi:DUF4082 domain-containing protein [Anabaena sp. WFMT]|uniref:DUF4082 domain-containing protein n=1 Tax=Anabaena sp. WFMT TaxID=3449730 RepID=UPI003F27A1D6
MTTVNKLTKLSITATGAVFVCLGIAGTAHAAAINFDSTTIDSTNGNWSLGFKFTTNQDVAVNQLGFYDDLKNDLTETHDVGIFDDLGTLLVSGTVKPGDALDGWFRYTSIPTTILDAGKTFFIAATTGSENYTWNPINFTVDPAINYVTDVFSSSSTLVFPDQGSSTVSQGFFGPNFKYTTSVPEPASLIGILGLGAFGVTSLRKRKQQATVKA